MKLSFQILIFFCHLYYMTEPIHLFLLNTLMNTVFALAILATEEIGGGDWGWTRGEQRHLVFSVPFHYSNIIPDQKKVTLRRFVAGDRQVNDISPAFQ